MRTTRAIIGGELIIIRYVFLSDGETTKGVAGS
jgi:hypothetical protein